jgi:predicted Holliday junction resolvase-like endonuclease
MLLDYVFNESGFWFALVAIILVFLIMLANLTRLKKQVASLDLDVRIKKEQLQDQETKYKQQLVELAIAEFEKYKATQLESDKKLMEGVLLESAANMLQRWQMEKEESIRKDAIARSLSVNLGKITEHWLPFHTSFKFNPKDARFIGSPVDLIVFDGASENKDIIDIYFIEVKTGNSRLTPIQQKIKSSVLSKRINWVEMNPANL